MPPVIVFDRVSKSYPLYHRITAGLKRFLFEFPAALREFRGARTEVLRDVSFKVDRGETVGIIGRNGAGKSTLLLLLAGVIKPSRGTVTIRERVSPLLELGSGFHPELSGRENIELNGVILGLSRREVLDRQEDIIEFSEIGDYIDQPLRIYSSGMVARLAFSVVVHLDPKIFLIDEILAVGDSAFQQKCLDKMTSFRGKGVTTILVSHTMSHVERICDRVIWIEDHGIKACGPPAEIVAAYMRNRS